MPAPFSVETSSSRTSGRLGASLYAGRSTERSGCISERLAPGGGSAGLAARVQLMGPRHGRRLVLLPEREVLEGEEQCAAVLRRDDLRTVQVEPDLRQTRRQRDRLVDRADAVRQRRLVAYAGRSDRDRRRLRVRLHVAAERDRLRLLPGVDEIDPTAR